MHYRDAPPFPRDAICCIAKLGCFSSFVNGREVLLGTVIRWGVVWPLLLILLGLWFLAGNLSPARPVRAAQTGILLQGAAQAHLRLRHGAGRLPTVWAWVSHLMALETVTAGITGQWYGVHFCLHEYKDCISTYSL